MFSSFNSRAVGLSLTASQSIELAAASGFDGVDLLVRDLVNEGADLSAVAGQIADRGLRPGAWPLPIDWRGGEESFRADLEVLPRYAAAAAQLGLTRTGTWVLPFTELAGLPLVKAPQDPVALFDWHVDRLGAIARVLGDHGSVLGLEVIGVASFGQGAGLPFVNRLGALPPLLNALRSRTPDVGVLVDAFHLFAAGEAFEVLDAFAPGELVWAHVADLPREVRPDRRLLDDHRRALPGTSHAVDVAGFLRALKQKGYQGPVTVESFSVTPDAALLCPGDAVGLVAVSLKACWPAGAGRAGSSPSGQESSKTGARESRYRE